MTKPQTLTPEMRREAERQKLAKKSMDEARAWVEKNTLPHERCGRCGGLGLEEIDEKTQNCVVCGGDGKKR